MTKPKPNPLDLPRDIPLAKQIMDHFGGVACAVVLLLKVDDNHGLLSAGVDVEPTDPASVECMVRLLIGLDEMRRKTAAQLASYGFAPDVLDDLRATADITQTPRKPAGDA